MPQQIVTFNSAQDQVHMSWAEPYVTSGLNARDMVVRPRGTYRGFRLSATGLDANITITPDPVGNDHVAVVYDTQGIYALEVRRTGGSFTVSMTSEITVNPNQPVILALVGFYSPGTATSLVLQAYTQSEFNSAPEVVNGYVAVLGTAVLGSTTVLSVNYSNRTETWQGAAPESNPWVPMLVNGGFDRGPTGTLSVASGTTNYLLPEWQLGVSLGTGTFALEQTLVNAPPSGPGPGANLFPGTQALQWTSGGVSQAGSSTATQAVGARVGPGQLVSFNLWVYQVQALSSGTVTVQLNWLGPTGTGITATSLSANSTLVVGSWELFTQTVSAPAGAAVLGSVQIVLSSAVFPAAGAALYFDDMQLWVETNSPQAPNYNRELRRTEDAPGYVIVQDPGATPNSDWSASTPGGVLHFDSTSMGAPTGGQLIFERRDQSTATAPPYLNVKGQITLGQNLIGTAANSQIARLEMPASSAFFTLLQETPQSIIASSHTGARVYVTEFGDYYIVNNCTWSNAGNSWTYDDNSHDATALVISGNFGGIYTLTFSGGGPTWTNVVPPTSGGWTTQNILTNGLGNATVHGNEAIAGNATVGGTLTVTNTATFDSNAVVDGSLTVNGDIVAEKQVTIGQNMLGSAAQAATARLEIPATGSFQFTLLQETPQPVSASGYTGSRIYIGQFGDIYIVSNAFWNNTSNLWTYDSSESDAVALVISGVNGRCQVLTFTAAGPTWTNAYPPTAGGWQTLVMLSDSSGQSQLVSLGVNTFPTGTGNIQLTGGLGVNVAPGSAGTIAASGKVTELGGCVIGGSTTLTGSPICVYSNTATNTSGSVTFAFYNVPLSKTGFYLVNMYVANPGGSGATIVALDVNGLDAFGLINDIRLVGTPGQGPGSLTLTATGGAGSSAAWSVPIYMTGGQIISAGAVVTPGSVDFFCNILAM